MDSILNKDWIIDYKTLSTNVIEQGKNLIVLLPGYSISGKWALKHYPALLKDSTCYAINWPGYYGSDLIDSNFSVDILHEFITQVLTEHKQKSFHLIGHSFGGRVALAYAAKYYEQIDKLSLIAPVVSVNPLEAVFSILPQSFINYLVRKCISKNGLNRLARFLNSLALLRKTDQDFILRHTDDQNAMGILQYYASSLSYLQISNRLVKDVFKLIPNIDIYVSKHDPYSNYNYWCSIKKDNTTVKLLPLKGGHFGRILD